MGQELRNRATNQKLYANDFQKVGCSSEWRENSDSPVFRPKWAETYPDTLDSFKGKGRQQHRCWKFLVSANPLIYNGICFDKPFSHSVDIYTNFYFISLSPFGVFIKSIAFLDFSLGRIGVVLKRTEFCLFRRPVHTMSLGSPRILLES